MTARPMTIYRSGPAFEAQTGGAMEAVGADTAHPNPVAVELADVEGPVIEMTAHLEDGGHPIGWYPATPEGLICAGGEFARLRGYGFRHPPVCTISGQIIPQDQIEIAVVVPLCGSEACRRALALLRVFDAA